MKRAKTLLILCGILAVSVIAIFIEKAVKNHIDSINIIDEEIFSISEEDITSLTFEYNGDTVTLNHGDEGWTYDEDDSFPVDQEYRGLQKEKPRGEIFIPFLGCALFHDACLYGNQDSKSSPTVNFGRHLPMILPPGFPVRSSSGTSSKRSRLT